MGRKSILSEARERNNQEQEEEQEPEDEQNPEENEGPDSGPSTDRSGATQDEEIQAWTHRAPETLVDRVDLYADQKRFPSRKFAINYILETYLDEEGVE